MKFQLIDKIESIEPGKRIVTIKALSLAEEYLADHFPVFPVLPGVLMLEALTQSAAWLVRIQQNFARSFVVLSTARNVRYANFVQPGNILRCEVEATDMDGETAKFKGTGYVDNGVAVSAKLELRSFNLTDNNPAMAAEDQSIIAEIKNRFRLVGGPAALAAAES